MHAVEYGVRTFIKLVTMNNNYTVAPIQQKTRQRETDSRPARERRNSWELQTTRKCKAREGKQSLKKKKIKGSSEKLLGQNPTPLSLQEFGAVELRRHLFWGLQITFFK